VTGSSRGIGRACAIELARSGADVVINHYGAPAEAEEVAGEVRALGQRALVIGADVSDEAEVQAMVDRAVEEFGGVDGLVTCAVYSDREPMLTADMAGFRRTIDVTMWGTFNALRAVAARLVEQGTGGAIVIVSSPHAVVAVPSAMAYNMAKAAVDHMARTAAIELAQFGIRVNVVHPGWTDTPGERKFFTEQSLEAGARNIPLGRLARPEEIGRLIRFMLSDDCAYMTGSTVVMDGGFGLPWWAMDRQDRSGA